MTNFNYTGLLTCSHYAFPPNSLHYCGPEKQNNLIGYQQEQIADQGLVEIIRDFQTLYPYLRLIAFENNIEDPFDPRVVEAYWIGNNLLNNVSMKNFNIHLTNSLGLKKKIKKKDLDLLIGKIPQGAFPHHTFHVLNVFTRTGHHTVEHTLETMDSCRISWGKIVQESWNIKHGTKHLRHPELLLAQASVSGSILVETQPLSLENGKLALGKSAIKEIKIPYSLTANSQKLKTNSLISFHWNTFCDVITTHQAKQLEYFTKQALLLANTTL